ncbi:reverse transcriptase domain-containing protein [Artemisia annua]|uniref:Reverse transcriptase domain-containing protein n=1 Tax=Artemisia annua TaxID=35608 RepID=A0A2U1LBD8_ARTAN|nr:reverse transcriptase domain-containing protein [Artemisia annua]
MTTPAPRKTKGKEKKLEGRSKSALGITLWRPNGGYNQRSPTDLSVEAHLSTIPQGKSKKAQIRPDTEMDEGSKGKQLKSGKENSPKKESFAFACIYCGKSNYKYPQEAEISSEESSDMNSDEEAENIYDGGNDRMQLYMPEEVDPFMKNIRDTKLPKGIRIPDNVPPYDGSKYPVNHIRVFQLMAQVHNWDTATQCHMFKHTLRGATRIWFEHLPQESISGFHELRDAFLEFFLSIKRHKDRDKKIRCAKRGRDESIEDFKRRFLTESRRAKKMPEAAESCQVHGKSIRSGANKAPTLGSTEVHGRSGKNNTSILPSGRSCQEPEAVDMTPRDRSKACKAIRKAAGASNKASNIDNQRRTY